MLLYALPVDNGSSVISTTPNWFDVPDGYILVECPEWVTIGTPYEDGQFVSPPVYTPTLEEAKAEKLEAVKTAFLAASEAAHCMSSVGFEIDANETANRDSNGPIVVEQARGKESEQIRD